MSATKTKQPVAAVLECAVCKTPYVLRWCIVLKDGGSHECYAFFRDCERKSECDRELRRLRKTDPEYAHATVRTDDEGNPSRIPVQSFA